MFCLKLGIYQFKSHNLLYTFNKSHLNLFILLVFSFVANFRYMANFTFLTLNTVDLYYPTFYFPNIQFYEEMINYFFYSVTPKIFILFLAHSIVRTKSHCLEHVWIIEVLLGSTVVYSNRLGGYQSFKILE